MLFNQFKNALFKISKLKKFSFELVKPIQLNELCKLFINEKIVPINIEVNNWITDISNKDEKAKLKYISDLALWRNRCDKHGFAGSLVKLRVYLNSSNDSIKIKLMFNTYTDERVQSVCHIMFKVLNNNDIINLLNLTEEIEVYLNKELDKAHERHLLNQSKNWKISLLQNLIN